MEDIKKVIVGLDIGTTKVCAIVGATNEHGKVEILGMGKAESLGVIRGEVRNIDKTVKAIREAVEKAKQSMANGKIQSSSEGFIRWDAFILTCRHSLIS